ncbi:MAG: DNA-processing protein DprA [Jatrophihabitans sp.]
MSEEILLARAYLNRVAEPANIPLWDLVRTVGPEAAADLIRRGAADEDVTVAVSARAVSADPHADLAAAERHGIRLLVPESDEWPHYGFAALERTGLERVEQWHHGNKRHSESGEEIPPLALWAKGPLDAAELSVRSVGIVGARAATEYGCMVAREFASALARMGFVVVSGGAYGVDAAAHFGALSGGGKTVAVSAGGLDRAYPSGHITLFGRIAESGLLLSESPPGSAPARRRFLTRNRLIAALSTGTILVEAASRSGALNTINHATKLDRQTMAVPGPVTSRMSRGCHDVLARETNRATLVTCMQDVVELIGSSSDVNAPTRSVAVGAPADDALRSRLDGVDEGSRRIFDGFPSTGSVSPDELIVLTGASLGDVLGALPTLELARLIEQSSDGFRIATGLQLKRGRAR